MITDQAPTPVSARFTSMRKLSNIQRIENVNGYIPMGLSLDRTTMYFRRNLSNGIFASTDGGVTITQIKTMPYNVQAIAEFERSGEVLVLCTDGSGIPSRLYKSSGWRANKAAATFDLKMTGKGSIAPHWSLPQQAVTSDLALMIEYGNKTSATAADSPNNLIAATCCYRSLDEGETWTTAFDMLNDPQSGSQPPGNQGNHLHSGCVYKNNTTLLFGDNTGTGHLTRGLGYMQALRSTAKGAPGTWEGIPQPSDYQAAAANDVFQMTAVMETAKALIMVPDNKPYGVLIVPKLADGTLAKPRFGPMYTGSNLATGIIGWQITRAAGANMPIFATAHVVNDDALASSNATKYHVRIMMSENDGIDWNQAYDEISDGRTRVSEPIVFGPDVNGNCIWQSGYNNNGVWANGSLTLAKLS